jgi:hypothetical protein
MSGDIISDVKPGNWIVSGFFTPDYRPLAQGLAASLDKVGDPYHFFATEKRPGGWEANTMAKAQAVATAMAAHPGRMILFLDVDTEVVGSMAPLAATFTGDVGIRFRPKRRKGRLWMTVRSSTLVLNATEGARRFVARWIEEGRNAPPGEIDQTTFALAMVASDGVRFEPLALKWCAMDDDHIDGAIVVHQGVSQDAKKIRGLRLLGHQIGAALFRGKGAA